jgi:hypothetical protein
MNRALTTVGFFALACSHPTSNWRGEQLVLADRDGRVVERLGSDGVVTDHAGRVAARYDARRGTMTFPAVPGQTLDVRASVTVRGAREIDLHEAFFEPFRIRVTDTNEVRSHRITSDGHLDRKSSRCHVVTSPGHA